ncbi:hypothetical protein [Aporhodopirellula aestuarii]|uniref:Transmembrane protein n=1 Tax=Aporhodopirellula aestuarii TaxID=2950107 RepID=A0ABT0UBU3_9BACT|nr:hypothetical protein [Aporhodopirellula aestuarii]MCM2374388.1 hypothetical protein [Aporhodopirellula aestuarii]
MPSVHRSSALAALHRLGEMGYGKTMLMWAVFLFLICWLTGRWEYHVVSDTPSYQQYVFSPAEALAREIRTPGYPLVLRVTSWLTSTSAVALQLVVLAQILLHAAACTGLMLELRSWRIPASIAMIAAGAVGIGCTFWDNISTIATDCPAMSLGVATATCMMRGWRLGFSPRLSTGIALLIVAAISLRPAYLFLLPWAALMTLVRPLNGHLEPWSRRLRDVVWVTTIPVVFLLGWCLFRYTAVSDFALLPFGHQNMAAVTTQLLDEDELKSLPGKTGELATRIAELRVEVSRRGSSGPTSNETADAASPLPTVAADGLDLRTSSDPSKRADSYMTLENRWDAMTYLVVVPAAIDVAGDDIVDQHQLLAELDKQIVRSYPVRYVRWWLLAVRRGIWGSAANMVMHPIFLVLILTATGMTAWRCLRPMPCSSTAQPSGDVVSAESIGGYRAFVLMAISYAGAKLAFVALTSPPIGRFSDSAFVFAPSIVAIAFFVISDVDDRCNRSSGALGPRGGI